MKLLLAFFSAWTWKMAWRDSRASRRKLLLFSASIVIGIAALVAISSLAENFRTTIQEQAKALLGADLVLTARDPFTPEMESLFEKIGGEQAREVVFSSMVSFQSGGTRLVQVRALEKGFPFYGGFETAPPGAGTNFQSGSALVEETLLAQFDSHPGDSIKVGQLSIPVLAALQKVPGENAVFSTIAPRVYIPMDRLQATELMSNDSLARFKVFFKLPLSTDVEGLVRRYRTQFQRLGLNSDTVEERKANLGHRLENLNRFLALGGFIALLLGAIGIASGIHVHVKQKTGSVAILRCLGCSVSQTFAIYMAQAVVLGAAGALAGCILGLGVQHFLPLVLADFLPFQVKLHVAWLPVLRAMGAGFAVALIFALLPLASVRKISPLAVLRSLYETGSTWRDPVYLFLVFLGGAGLMGLARVQAGRWSHALGVVGGLAAAFLLLVLTAQILRWILRRLVSTQWPFAWRQGIANLYRPRNRTLLLLLSLGLGVFLVFTLYRINEVLARGLFPEDQKDQPNAALFDIQADQIEAVKRILTEQDLPILADVPIVTMRLASIKGEPVQKILRDNSRDIPRWILRREYRSTYRDTLDTSEVLVRGAWPVPMRDDSIIPVSVEEGIARDLKVDLGDELVFDLQGILLTNKVVSIRKVDWKRIQPNFFMVFPPASLAEAPGFHIVTTRTPDRERSATMQRAVIKELPNVSIIDLALVLDTIDAILRKVGFVFRFMALFTIATGLIVLAASILAGRYQRIQETILLRTLGASRKQVHRILAVEYLFLGVLAAMTGVVLAEFAAWGLSRFMFSAQYHFSILPALITVAVVSGATLLVGLLANRGVLDRPPLEVLRGTT